MLGRSNKQYAALPTDDVQGDDAPTPRSSVESTVSQQTLPYPVVSEKPKPTSLPTFVYVAYVNPGRSLQSENRADIHPGHGLF